MQKYALIVAGGSGSRMQSFLPKQFIEVLGRPILMHTLEAFEFDTIQIILVLPESQIEVWEDLCRKHQFQIPHQIVKGGETRFHSVRNGLQAITGEGLVAIHDGVRPLIARDIIQEAYKVADKQGNAIVSVPLKDSIRVLNASTNKQVDRGNYRLIQTPQTFRVALIKEAFATDYREGFTDDASVLEAYGTPIHLIDGDYRNIKITTPEDLKVAETLLQD